MKQSKKNIKIQKKCTQGEKMEPKWEMVQKTYFTNNEVESSRKVPNPNLQNAKKGAAIKATNTKGLD